MRCTTDSRRPATVCVPAPLAPAPAERAGRARHGRDAGPCHSPRATSHGGDARRGGVSAATLQRLEDALRGSLLDLHPNRQRAMDRLLRDLEGTGKDERPPAHARRAVSAAACTPERLRRIEDMLVGAVIDSHPKRNTSLDRLLADLGGGSATEQPAADHYDATLDKNFNGLG